MSDDKKLTPAERLKAVEERSAKKAEAIAAAREEQYATDREKIAELEEKLGQKVYISNQVRQFTQGFPVVVGIRAPTVPEYKRLFSQINRTKGNDDAKVAAHQMLAQVCWVYPEEPESREAMLEANSGLLASIGNYANKLAEVEIDDEGKG